MSVRPWPRAVISVASWRAPSAMAIQRSEVRFDVPGAIGEISKAVRFLV
ncbi:hypothetical protein ALSL_0428 [Aerosticca soli]|uniref:Uncharacterized protein n=1 Tax=Aerosticca soli TaxID=2010829 RepID=A0A2Z6E3E8_9GAMM|nr:hypothetical protein ALSL_0428 [Aerosticca soli]